MAQKQEESLLKGTENVPNALAVQKLLESRSNEINSLEDFISQKSGTKLIFQRLPKHMRRRSMSHNVKRLPRKVQSAHSNQMQKSGVPPKTKRPSRKFRRKPSNLQEEYLRRQQHSTWLETHLWHAKRFHMIDRWGYKLPDRPSDKAFRACYRAVAKHCLLQDISYIGLIQISGPEDILLSKFKSITSQYIGLTIGSRAYKNGNREGEVIFYHIDDYPYKAIGPVKFMWKPQLVTDNERFIWLWVHAAFYSEVTEVLIKLFNLTKIKTSDTYDQGYENKSLNVSLKEYQNNINRFRLTGPLAHCVIKKSLHIAAKNNSTDWFVDYIKSSNNKTIYNEQNNFWNALQSISCQSELSPHIILHLIITDPRYSLPLKRTKAVIEDVDSAEVPNIPAEIKYGPIWSDDVRSTACSIKLSNTELYLQRSNKLVPDINVPTNASAIPVMLVQQPGSKDNLGYSSGWDIIAPFNWGNALWLSFIMRGARVGGLRESDLIRFEQGLPDFLEPDTLAGQTEDNHTTNNNVETFFNLPANKRINFNKMGIASPFKHPWTMLIQDWRQRKVDKFYVMRDKKLLRLLQDFIVGKNVSLTVNFDDNCIIPVKINLWKRGRISKYAIICIPKEQDCIKKVEPSEPDHEDTNEMVRKVLRQEHLKLLKKLRKTRVRNKESNKIIESADEVIADHAEKMKKLWLPAPKSIRKSCSREIFGFVTKGDFSFSTAKGQCIGYVALKALSTILSRNSKERSTVLVRDTASKQYRFAKLEIIF